MPAGYDTDAAAYFAAAGITDDSIKGYVNDFVLGLKADGVWSKLQAFYPYIGGTGASNSINLINPATFQVTWSGGVTHSADGVQGNASNGYGSTGYVPSVDAALNSAHLMVYNKVAPTYGYEIGAYNTTNPSKRFNISTWWYVYIINAGVVGDYSYPNTTPRTGMTMANRTASNIVKLTRNGSLIETSTMASTVRPTNQVRVLALGIDAGVGLYCNSLQSCASIGRGLTDAETTNYYTRVQTLMTQLGRNV